MLKTTLIKFIRIFSPAREYLDKRWELEDELGRYKNEVHRLEKVLIIKDHELDYLNQKVPKSLPVTLSVTESDLAKALLPEPKERLLKSNSKHLTISWVVPAMGSVTGGHTDIFRIINYLERLGHDCRVYFYDSNNGTDLNFQKEFLKINYPKIKSKLFYNSAKIEDCDALVATGWDTAYVVRNFTGRAKKYYFIQDFEPYFYPASTSYLLAEKTYTFNMSFFTLGKWLADKLDEEYEKKCDYLDFGVDTDLYCLKNRDPRKEVFCYVRPVSPRRGFELAIMALKQFHKKHPDYKINLMGWDVSSYQIPFPYINHKTLSTSELNDLYNKCSAGLVISYTNMSLLPLEALAAGTIPIVNEGLNTKTVKYYKWVKYAKPSAESLALALDEVISREDLIAYSKEASEDVIKYDWEKTNSKVERIFMRDLRN